MKVEWVIKFEKWYFLSKYRSIPDIHSPFLSAHTAPTTPGCESLDEEEKEKNRWETRSREHAERFWPYFWRGLVKFSFASASYILEVISVNWLSIIFVVSLGLLCGLYPGLRGLQNPLRKENTPLHLLLELLNNPPQPLLRRPNVLLFSNYSLSSPISSIVIGDKHLC